jgi:aminoglycoside 6'-N-acetyltransferase
MDTLVLRPLKKSDTESLRRIRSLPEVEHWWDPVEPDFPMGDEPKATRFAIVYDDTVVGMVQFTEESEPKYRQAGIDIFLDPAVHGRGIGTEAIKRTMRLLIERSHHRLTIDPAVDNAAAIRTYEKAGFRKVGTMKQAERDSDGAGWHDALLMEWVSGIDPVP